MGGSRFAWMLRCRSWGGFDLRDRTDAVLSAASGIPNRHPGVLVSGDVGRGVLRAHRSGSAEFVFDQAPATILDRQRTARAETHRICHDHARTGLGDTAIGAGAGRAEHPEAATAVDAGESGAPTCRRAGQGQRSVARSRGDVADCAQSQRHGSVGVGFEAGRAALVRGKVPHDRA